MSEGDIIELKVGDKVRLIGEQWSRDPNYLVNTGDVVTVNEIIDGSPYAERAENLTDQGVPSRGYEIEKVSDAPVPEPRDVTLPGVVADIETLLTTLTGLGFARTDAWDAILEHIEQGIEND